jgi:hypothetical protein
LYRNPPSTNPWAGVWTDGTSLNYLNWAGGDPNNYGGYEICVLIYSSSTTGCIDAETYASRRGKWVDLNPTGYVCGTAAVVCELQCTTAQFPIDDCKLM